MSTYEAALVIIAVGLLGAIVLPRLLAGKPLSLPMFYVALGGVLFTVVPTAPTIDPVANSTVTEHLTELVVIIALMGAGLKIDRPFDVTSWSATWRLIGITMPLTIGAVALLSWMVLGLHPATAILLGAVLAPTDPVLASDVDAGAPLTELEKEAAPAHRWGSVRFSLTSEAGLNDGLAFPFTYLAIAVAAADNTTTHVWLVEWALVDGLYRVAVGLLLGYAIGNLMARLVFYAPAPSHRAEIMAGAEAIVATLLAYGVTELLGGYGFIAVFVAALELRRYEWEHEYHRELHDFAALVERLLMAAVLVLFGAAIADGLLAPLTGTDVLVGLAVIVLVRPLAGLLGFVGSDAPWSDRTAISFFGIRGIGSFYYLSFALAHVSFEELELLIAAERLWALVGLVVLASIVLHGVTAGPVMNALERRRNRPTPPDDTTERRLADERTD
ncbi:sodium/proton antiporter, CPA1 family (TC 2.A.36) [Natronorubrum sediminis]|uniref:Sodium/proton antiporter, CPA1 family (TC 2.A.36) n=1 Tax=Natronorubrum sediminis TaxID=640943 RepID=A0A1H6G2W3_9EURY|nr:cation:proton antiporter [Natronorubrum sediminis]SEH17417.1 sodium/proton antiporter, CPA1 family (TC 2.A.36) [Natronorubrum sediminis]